MRHECCSGADQNLAAFCVNGLAMVMWSECTALHCFGTISPAPAIGLKVVAGSDIVAGRISLQHDSVNVSWPLQLLHSV